MNGSMNGGVSGGINVKAYEELKQANAQLQEIKRDLESRNSSHRYRRGDGRARVSDLQGMEGDGAVSAAAAAAAAVFFQFGVGESLIRRSSVVRRGVRYKNCPGTTGGKSIEQGQICDRLF